MRETRIFASGDESVLQSRGQWILEGKWNEQFLCFYLCLKIVSIATGYELTVPRHDSVIVKYLSDGGKLGETLEWAMPEAS